MEKRSGYLECPKCGLRNKPTAVQCDFCGQSLTSSDDWQDHVKDLESLTRIDSGRSLDDRTSRRIESTLIRKETGGQKPLDLKDVSNLEHMLRELDQSPKEAKPEPEEQKIEEPPEPPAPAVEIAEPEPEAPVENEVEIPAPSATEVEQEPEEIVEEEVVEAPPIPEKAERPPEEDIPPVVEYRPEEVQEAEAEAPVVAEQEEDVLTAVSGKDVEVDADGTAHVTFHSFTEEQSEEPEAEATEGLMAWNKLIHNQRMAAGVLALGIVTYLLVLSLTAVGSLGTTVALGGGAVGSMMVIFGGLLSYPHLRHKRKGDVLICPNCHEVVDVGDEGCPSCGTTFVPED